MKKDVLLEIGTKLKKKRLKARVSLTQLSKQLRVKRAYLKAIEDGDDKILKFDAYTIGYIRHYANAFNLDPNYFINLMVNNIKQMKIAPIASQDLITGKEFLPSRKVLLIITAILTTMYLIVEILV